jgi:hypothetical protein
VVANDNTNTQQPPEPNPDLKNLDRLVGTWEVSGGAQGRVGFEWMEGGFFLIQHVDLERYSQRIKGIEIIGHEQPFGSEPSEELKSRFYDNMGNTLDYVYELEGDTLTIWGGEKGSPAYYRGAFSEDGNTLSGHWHYPGAAVTSQLRPGSSREGLMTEDATAVKPVRAMSRIATLLSFAGAVMFVVLLAVLHFIRAELDPSWHFISEYAIGDYGWIMVLAFLSLALSYVSLFVATHSQLRTIVGRIGLVLLLVSALGLTIAAIFTTDPITVSKDDVTTEGSIHNLGGTLGIAMPFAAGLIGWKLARNPAWFSAKGPLLLATGLALVAFVVSFVSLGVMVAQSGGEFGPEVLIGWPTRMETLAYCVWLMTVAWQALKLRTTTFREHRWPRCRSKSSSGRS